MGDLSAEFIRRLSITEGVRPAAAKIPPPGIYWIKTTQCDFYWIDRTGARLARPSHNEIWAVYTWDLQKETEWFLARVYKEGSIEVMGSDEYGAWEGEHFLVTQVGPRVEPPTETIT